MKSNRKAKTIILIILGIFFAFLPILFNNPRFIVEDRDITSNYNEEFDHDNLQIYAISGKIHIINNSGWVAFRSAGNCTGNGTYSEPYVIEDLVIDGGGSGNCIWIENSSLYFKIENCTVYNSGGYPNAGILLSNVNNSQLTNNNCSTNNSGIILSLSHNNTISGNIANNNTGDGIRFSYSHNNAISGNTVIDNNERGIFFIASSNNNTISGNTANGGREGIFMFRSVGNNISGNTLNTNRWYGLRLRLSNDNSISGNTANNNTFYGIYLDSSDYNIISGNTLIGNFQCIYEENCEGNIFSNNDSCTYGISEDRIPIYIYIFFLLGILSVVALLITKKVKKS